MTPNQLFQTIAQSAERLTAYAQQNAQQMPAARQGFADLEGKLEKASPEESQLWPLYQHFVRLLRDNFTGQLDLSIATRSVDPNTFDYQSFINANRIVLQSVDKGLKQSQSAPNEVGTEPSAESQTEERQSND